jgi:von Willebrand factor type A domain
MNSISRPSSRYVCALWQAARRSAPSGTMLALALAFSTLPFVAQSGTAAGPKDKAPAAPPAAKPAAASPATTTPATTPPTTVPPTTAPPTTTPPATAPPETTTPPLDTSTWKVEPAQLDVYVKPDGGSYFALTLPAQADLPKPAGHDIIVLFDTSASQAGDARERGLAALNTLISTCEAPDRISLMAVDLAPVPLTAGLVDPDSSELKVAVERLIRRVPLGATDLPLAFTTAAATFSADSGNAKAVVYIGDGVSASQLFVPATFAKLTDQLVTEQIPVISYGVGPRVDGQMLVALANYTGGNVVLDDETVEPKAAGLFLATSARGPVVWITTSQWPKAFDEVYPRKLPPLRNDRETVLIGKGSLSGTIEVAAQGQSDGKLWQRRWSAKAGPSNDDFSYIPLLVSVAEKDDGVTLPTLGARGLKQIGKILIATAAELITLAQQAMAAGSLDDADRFLDEALRRDPADPAATGLRKEIAKRRAEQKPAVVEPKKPGTGKPVTGKPSTTRPGSKPAGKAPANKKPIAPPQDTP